MWSAPQKNIVKACLPGIANVIQFNLELQAPLIM